MRALFVAKGGVATGLFRFHYAIYTPSEMVDLQDIEATVKLRGSGPVIASWRARSLVIPSGAVACGCCRLVTFNPNYANGF